MIGTNTKASHRNRVLGLCGLLGVSVALPSCILFTLHEVNGSKTGDTVGMENHEWVTALNRSCQCITLDPEKLSEQLDDLVVGSYEHIRQAMPNTFSSGPVFIGDEQVASIIAIIAALDGLAQNDKVRADLLADAPPIASIENGAKGVFFGYDFHLAADGPKLIEINTNAGGAMLNLALGRAQTLCCDAVEPLMKVAYNNNALEESIVAMFLAEMKAANHPNPLRRIAIVDVDPPSQFLYPELLLFAALFERHGLETRIVGPEELTCDAGVLTHQGDVIDLVYNRLTDFYFEDETSSALRQAWDIGCAVITPHPHAYALFANKRNLVLLSDSQRLREFGVPEESIELLARAVPNTHRVRPEDGDKLWENRKNLFFKPAHGYGSRATYAGRKLTRKAFAAILTGDYVAQELIPPSERVVHVDGQNTSLKVDIRAYTYRSDILMFSARVYRGQVTNLRTPGGGFAPLYVLPKI